jgi:hypothetical protein
MPCLPTPEQEAESLRVRVGLLEEALHKIDTLSDYDETNEWVDVYGLMEDIGNICRELKEAGTL